MWGVTVSLGKKPYLCICLKFFIIKHLNTCYRQAFQEVIHILRIIFYQSYNLHKHLEFYHGIFRVGRTLDIKRSTVPASLYRKEAKAQRGEV